MKTASLTKVTKSTSCKLFSLSNKILSVYRNSFFNETSDILTVDSTKTKRLSLANISILLNFFSLSPVKPSTDILNLEFSPFSNSIFGM